MVGKALFVCRRSKADAQYLSNVYDDDALKRSILRSVPERRDKRSGYRTKCCYRPDPECGDELHGVPAAINNKRIIHFGDLEVEGASQLARRW